MARQVRSTEHLRHLENVSGIENVETATAEDDMGLLAGTESVIAVTTIMLAEVVVATRRRKRTKV